MAKAKFDRHYFARTMTLFQIGERIKEIDARLAYSDTDLDRRTLQELKAAAQLIQAQQAGMVQ